MSRRQERLSKLLKEEIAYILKDSKDPRLNAVVITRLELSQDGKNAKVFYTTIPEGKEEEAQKALEGAKRYIKGELLRRLDLKFVPELTFKFDKELKSFERIWEKLS